MQAGSQLSLVSSRLFTWEVGEVMHKEMLSIPSIKHLQKLLTMDWQTVEPENSKEDSLAGVLLVADLPFFMWFYS